MILCVSPFLMAILCEKEEPFPPIVFNKTKVTLSEGSNFSTSDTLWISGKVSSMVYNEGTGDSLMNSDDRIRDIISIMRLKTADEVSNTSEAINEFELVTRIGNIDFLGACPESELIALGLLTESGQQFAYEIGLVPQNMGDFVLSWLEPAILTNSNLNTQILGKYPVKGDRNYLGLSKCGITYSILDVKASRNEFFFTVN